MTSLSRFIETHCDKMPSPEPANFLTWFAPAKQLYDEYALFCRIRLNCSPVSKKEFVDAIGPLAQRDGGEKGFVGLRQVRPVFEIPRRSRVFTRRIEWK